MSFRTMQAVLDNSIQPPSEKYLLLLIAYTENEKDGRCNPSKKLLAFYHNTTERNLRARMDILVGAGELVISGRAGHSNHYTIPLYPNEPGFFDPGPCQETDEHRCNGHHGPLLNRTELAMRDNPRWRAQQSRKQEASRKEWAEPQFRGDDGRNPSSGGAEPQFRGGRNPSSGGAEPQFPQNMNEQEVEQEMNRGVAPSINEWLFRSENFDVRRTHRFSEQIQAYEAWCEEQGLEPVR